VYENGDKMSFLKKTDGSIKNQSGQETYFFEKDGIFSFDVKE
jgi:hypothetical protein